MIAVTRMSPLTRVENTMELPITQEQLDEFERPGRTRLIQDIFPELTPPQREFVKTGYTPEDWQAIFGSGEDEEPISASCRSCGWRGELDDPAADCPRCGCPDTVSEGE